ncbi:MAG: PD40 domain-containing protein, partial [Planctomycetes bacterium]|nr:PD40 domain-containing protein [Planctomycetota bacterium]
RDVWAGVTTYVSKDPFGQPGNGTSGSQSLSADGTYVVFSSSSSNLVPNDTNGRADVFLVEWQADPPLIERISVSSEGEQADGGSGNPSITADGRYVMFASDATNLVPEGRPGIRVYVRDRLEGTTRMVSKTVIGEWGNGSAIKPHLSCDGTHVVFLSSASNLVPGDANGRDDVYLRALDVPLLTSGDGDCDGDIDFADFALVQRCFTGDALNAPLIGPECYALDFNFDGHVDHFDFAEYLAARSGPR